MRALLFTLISLIGVRSFSSAELYQIDVRSMYKDSKASRANLVLKEGEAFNYTDSHQNNIEVIATEHSIGEGENIQLEFVISREDSAGDMVVLFASKMVTVQNKKSGIETATEDGDKISLIVKAKRL